MTDKSSDVIVDDRGILIKTGKDRYKILHDGKNQTAFGNPILPEWQDVTVTEDVDFVTVDNADDFIFKFRKGTAGYNEIRQNGTVVVEDERWRLEYLGPGNQWFMRGEPQSITWEQPEPHHVIVRRLYDDFAGTTFEMVYEFYGGFRPKLRFVGDIGQADTYRIIWRLTGINTTFIQDEPTEHRVKCWNSGSEPVVFDYNDVYTLFGDVTITDIVESANDHKLDAIFSVGSLTTGEFKLDPTFGYETEESGWDYISSNDKGGSKFSLTEDGDVTTIKAYLRGWQSCKAVIYDDDAGDPKNREGVSGEIELAGSRQWETFTFSPAVSLTSGTYWLCLLVEDSNEWNEASGDTDQYAYNDNTYSTPSDPFGSANFFAKKKCIYAIYLASDSEDLSLYFIVQQSASATCKGTFEVLKSDEEDLSGKFVIQKSDETDLASTFIVQKSDEKDLSGTFTIQKADEKDLSSVFVIQKSDEKDFSCTFTLQKSDVKTLSSTVEIQKSDEISLSSKAIIRNAGEADLSSQLIVQQFGEGNLSSTFILVNSGEATLSLTFIVQQSDEKDLSSTIKIINKGSADQSSTFVIQKTDTVDFSSTFIVQQSGLAEISSTIEIINKGTKDLSSTFDVQPFWIISVQAVPDVVIRTGVNTTELRCDWHDEADLAANQYYCNFWVREPDDATTYGPFKGNITKETAKEYNAVYDCDPQDSWNLGKYDVEARVYK